MARLKEKYNQEIKNNLQKKLGLSNVMEVPEIKKITVNMGVGEAVQDKKTIEKAVADLEKINLETFICAGLYDGIAPKENQKILENIPHSRCEFYNGGHLFLIEDSKAWRDIIEFLGC